MTEWREIGNGHATGNPSVAPFMCNYMVSLRRRKVRKFNVLSIASEEAKQMQAAAGNEVISARAITSAILKKLHEFNIQAEMMPGSGTPADLWGSTALRRLLHCLYLLSFWCLLRYDEALRICCEDVMTEQHPTQPRLFRLRINIPFRKTDQLGGEQLYYRSRYTKYNSIASRWFTVLPLPPTAASPSLPGHGICPLVYDAKKRPARREAPAISTDL
jgi:hypothetical protein